VTTLKSSLICSTYNQPRFLRMVLDSLLFQTSQSFECIIADDGSSFETKNLVEEFKEKAPFPVIHLWHEDQGWRKSQIHNLAISKAQTDHLIFIDGDCILAPDFVMDHQNIEAQQSSPYVLMGRRVELGEDFTKNLSLNNYQDKLFHPFNFSLLISCLKNDSRSWARKFSLRSPLVRALFNANQVDDLLGCNFSLRKSSMILINGFNDEMERGEDGDIFVRLRNSKHHLIGMKYYAVMFHLFHGRGNYQYVDDNYSELIQKRDYTWCPKGLADYL
jgi:glycosyltransferase involved in cell wall biosynthesis